MDKSGGIGGIGARPRAMSESRLSSRLTVGNCSGAVGIAEQLAADRTGNVARVETGERVERRMRDAGAYRLRQAERGGVDGAERRGDQISARARGDAGLARQQRAEILVGDRRGHEREDERAGADPRNAALPPRHWNNRTHPTPTRIAARVA